MVHYKIVKNRIYREELGRYVSYGIKVSSNGGRCIFEDVSVNRKSLRRVVKLCNKCRVDPRHLAEVIEDYLG